MRLKDKMENNEIHIIERILKGETALYEYFLNQHGQQVFSLVARIICNQEDADTGAKEKAKRRSICSCLHSKQFRTR